MMGRRKDEIMMSGQFVQSETRKSVRCDLTMNVGEMAASKASKVRELEVAAY